MQLLNEREKKVLELLIDDPHLSVADMGRHLDVSVVTVRSLFDTLSEKGYLIRTRGGALPAFHPDILARQRNLTDTKMAIARMAASLIADGDTVMIEAGTTTALIGRFLLGKMDVKVVTDSTLLLPYFRSNPALHVTFVGGIFHAESESMVGPTAVQHLEQFHVKTAFIGTDGFSMENGLTTHMMEATEIVRAMHRRSDRTVLLADSGKWNQAGFAQIIPLKEIDTLITDSALTAEARIDIESLGIEVLMVEK